jgi:hypothetical protein
MMATPSLPQLNPRQQSATVILARLATGDMVESRAHYTQALALYDPVEHRSLAARFGQDVGVAILSYRSLALWMLGYPEAALADADQAVKDARENGQAGTLMVAIISRHSRFA